jgi:hypothetical protein
VLVALCKEGTSDSISYAKSIFEGKRNHSERILWNKQALYLICEDEENSKLF